MLPPCPAQPALQHMKGCLFSCGVSICRELNPRPLRSGAAACPTLQPLSPTLAKWGLRWVALSGCGRPRAAKNLMKRKKCGVAC